MLDMTSHELRGKFLTFFKQKGHSIVPSSSLLPDDPSVLLTTAGMQQFKPYYTGKADPMTSAHPTLLGKPLGSKSAVSVQKCFRSSDIDEVGDETHLTFFEMLGNFSFGGYFKEEAINLAHDFFTKELGLNIEYVTVFEGDEFVPKDEESIRIWNKLGFSAEKGNLKCMGREDNFWGPTGSEGPCGPTTEIYINGTEIWNIVFNEYYCNKDKTLEKLAAPGVDTGMGLERLAMVVENVKNIFETQLFAPIIRALPQDLDMRIKRILADHARAVSFLVSDGVRPSNKEAGYVLRRLMRRILVYEYVGQNSFDSLNILKVATENYKSFYPELDEEIVKGEFTAEKNKFKQSIARGLKELSSVETIDAKNAFRLYESFGLPYEIIKELGETRASSLTREDFDKEFERHREISRAGREKKFGGHGLLLDTGELKAADERELKIVTRLHTATHLLQAALRKVLGDTIHQAGSDITAERLRFDFEFGRKLEDSELKQIEDMINDVVKRNLDMGYEEMPYSEAIKTGALYFEKEKYPPTVKVYTAKDAKTGEVFSRELCGGPHVEHTSELASFKILKEESVGRGIRRIRATVEPR